MPRELIRRYPLLDLFQPGQVDALLEHSHKLVYVTGETIFQESSAGVWAYPVLGGKIRILRRAEGDLVRDNSQWLRGSEQPKRWDFCTRNWSDTMHLLHRSAKRSNHHA